MELELIDLDRFKANYMMEVDEKVSTQQKRRAQGNELFKAGDYDGAIKRYDEAIEYAAMACEVCNTNVPYAEQHVTRKHIDEGKVRTAALSLLPLASSFRPLFSPPPLASSARRSCSS